MAKGQFLSHHQQKIVQRHYEHQDTILLQRLGELVTELYLADTPKKTDQLWKRVEKALAKTNAKGTAVRSALASRDVEGLARVVNTLNKGG